MNPRTTGILFLVALGLGAFVYLYEIRGGEARKQAEEAAKRLYPTVEAEAIEAIELRTSDGKQARFERHEGAWRLVEPISFPADEISLDSMASTLARLASEGVIEEPQAPEVYGFAVEEPGVRFRVGDQEQVLRIGKRAPVGGQTYVATEDLSRVYTVPSYRVSGFRKTLDDLREKRLLRFDRTAIRRIQARWPGGGVVLEKRDADWWLVEPLEATADQRTVESLLSDLSFLRASGFLDEPDPAARAALAQPEFEVTLEAAAADEAEEPARFHLAIGAPRDGEGRVARASEEILYTIATERLADFPREVVASRFKELASCSVVDAERFELVFRVEAEDREEALRIVGERDESGWSSRPERIAPGKAARLVSELSRLRAEDIAADAAGPDELAALGLSPPTVILRVFGEAPEGEEEARQLAEVHLGRADPERGILARTPAREEIFRLEYELAEHLPISLEAFRNRFVSKEPPAASEETEEGEAEEGSEAQDGASESAEGSSGGDS